MIGIIGKKIGMTQIFDEDMVIPVTVIAVEPNIVVHRKTQGKDKYDACVLGFGVKKKTAKQYKGKFKLANVKPAQFLREIRNPPSDWKVGERITVSALSPDSKVNVTGCSKGKGFAGGMKRYGWHGGPGSHGSKFHRRPGSVGTAEPGKTVKGHKLPGRMGMEKVTVKNLKLVKIDESKNLLFLKGAVPGYNSSIVIVRQNQ